MKEIRVTIPYHLNKLHDEIETEAIPSLASVGEGFEGVAAYSLNGRGNDVVLMVPDDADETAISAVISSHDASEAAVADYLAAADGRQVDFDFDPDKLSGRERKLMKLLFAMANQIRTNNGQSALTKTQFIEFVKGL